MQLNGELPEIRISYDVSERLRLARAAVHYLRLSGADIRQMTVWGDGPVGQAGIVFVGLVWTPDGDLIEVKP